MFIYENVQVYPYFNPSAFEHGVWPKAMHESVLILTVALCTHLYDSEFQQDPSAHVMLMSL